MIKIANAREFAKGLEQEMGYDRLLVESDENMRAIALDLYAGTTQDTPIKHGFLRVSWQISRGRPNLDIVEPVPGKTLSDGEIQSANNSAMASLGPDPEMKPIYITNNMPYAEDIEFGGSPRKAPDGMLRINIQRILVTYGA